MSQCVHGCDAGNASQHAAVSPFVTGLALVAALAGSAAVCAEEKAGTEVPLWEVGFGAGVLAFPDYRGSDEMQVFPAPLPYVIYRGKFLKSDRDGVRGELFDRKYAELSLSANGSIPVDSDDNDARSGMPDLKPTLELGPSLDLHVWRSADANIAVDVILPLRLPVTIASSPEAIGWIFAPRVNVDVQNVAGFIGWNLGVGAGPLFADRRYHDYYYSVAPRFATADRPEYAASGGYSGSHLLVSLSKRFPSYWVGAYVRADSVHHSQFERSPLVERSFAFTGGIGIAWLIAESERMVLAH